MCQFLAIIVLISGLGCDVLGAQPVFASTQSEQRGRNDLTNRESDAVYSCNSPVSELRLYFEAIEQEDYFEEMERKERTGIRSAFRGTLYSVISKGLLSYPSSLWIGHPAGLFVGRSGLESTIRFIHHSDGKK